MRWLNLVKKLFTQGVRCSARPVAPQAHPGLEQLESRLVPYTTSGNAWPVPQLITLSFVPDGTLISTSGGSTVASNLQATFNAKFG